MSVLVWTFAICAILFLSLMSLGNRFVYLRSAYFMGVSIWSAWLPVMAALGIFLLVALNAVGHPIILRHGLQLGEFLSHRELAFILLLTPLLLTSLSNYIALGLTIYLVERLLLGGSPGGIAAVFLISFSTILAVLGDFLPWAKRSRSIVTAQLREAFVIALSLGSLSLCLVTLLRVNDFNQWLQANLSLNISPILLFMGLAFILCGWISVAIGQTRHFMLPALCLPSIFVLAFVSAWPSYALAVPFAAVLALSLAIGDRRKIRRST